MIRKKAKRGRPLKDESRKVNQKISFRIRNYEYEDLLALSGIESVHEFSRKIVRDFLQKQNRRGYKK